MTAILNFLVLIIQVNKKNIVKKFLLSAIVGLGWMATLAIINPLLSMGYSLIVNCVIAILVGWFSAKTFNKYIYLLIVPFFNLLLLITVVFQNPVLAFVPFFIILFYVISVIVFRQKMAKKLFFIAFLTAVLILWLFVLPEYLILYVNTTEKQDLTKIHHITFMNNEDTVVLPSNKVVVLEYWDYSCGACYKKMDMLEELKNISRNDFSIVCAYAEFDSKREKNIDLFYKAKSNYLSKYKKLHFAYDSSYHLLDRKTGVPQTFIFSPDGKIVHSDIGFVEINRKKTLKKYLRIIEKYSK